MIKSLVRVSALGALLVSGAAFAADLPYSAPMAGPAPSYGGPYVGLKGGVNFTDDAVFVDTATGAALGVTEVETDTGFSVSGVAGYAWGSRWGILSPRMEVELGYLSNDADEVTNTNVALVTSTDTADGEINAFYGFANLLLDIPLGWGFTPFIGGGVGFANARLDNIVSTTGAGNFTPGTTIFDDEDTAFAWNVTAGLSYEISRGLTLEASYRFLQVNSIDIIDPGTGLTSEEDLDNHQILVGFRYKL